MPDEATSAADMWVDVFVERSISEQITRSTLRVIAHRPSIVADFGKVLVMSDGKMVEHGAPKAL